MRSTAVTLLALIVFIPATAAAQKYRYPIADKHVSVTYVTAYFDHSGKDYNCGSKRYSGHRGNDYGCGSFSGMDAGRDIVAAADGKVSYTHDGEYDRCTTANCSGGGGYGNYVKLTHSDGKVTYYAHMKKGSVAVKSGQTVKCGQKLGQVGSSGYSTGPHLHFEVRSGSSRRDPYKGSCGGYGYWKSQGSYLSKPGTTCDGPSGPVCGDGKCESGETSSSCPKDCKAKLDAKFAGQGSNALKGSGGQYYSLCPGQKFAFWFQLTNTGSLTWEDNNKTGTAGQAVRLGSKVKDPFGVADRQSVKSSSDSSVKPGETTKFTMTGKAPSKEGKYKTEWMLVSDGVAWFGPTMYLTYNVTATPPEAGQACDTGMPGVCKPGKRGCKGGAVSCQPVVPASPEQCDGKDNDCDGQVDEGVCPGREGAPTSDLGPGWEAGAGWPEGGPGGAGYNTLSGGCGCQSGPEGAAGGAPAMLLLLFSLLIRRNEKS